MHSPQQSDVKTCSSHLSRVLPQRSWAGAVPTLLTHEALEILCSPCLHPQGLPGPELAPLERFLGCVYMRRQLHRFIHNENYVSMFQYSYYNIVIHPLSIFPFVIRFLNFVLQLTSIPTNEPGVIHFKVGEMLQCRICLNSQHLQSLHLKITPLPDQKDVWLQEELQVGQIYIDFFTFTVEWTAVDGTLQIKKSSSYIHGQQCFQRKVYFFKVRHNLLK